MDEMLELKQEFLSEAFELLALMEEQVLELENNQESTESVNAIFRVAHTLKGGAAALELERIAEFTHNLENLLDLVRDGKLAVDEEIIDIVLKSLDILNALVKAAASNTEAPAGVETETLGQIKAKSSGGSSAQPVIVAPVSSPAPATVSTPPPVTQSSVPSSTNTEDDDSFKEILIDEFSIGDTEHAQIKSSLAESNHLFLIHVHLDDSNEMKSVSGIQTITAVRGLGTLVSAAPSVAEIMETEFIEHLQFLLLSKETQDKIFGKIYLSDVTKEVEISDISTMFGKVIEKQVAKEAVVRNGSTNPLDQIPEQNFLQYQEKIQEALNSGERVYNIRVLINEDAPMRDVDSLLVITSLEEVGDVINSNPTKRDLQQDVYYPILDIILESAYGKDIIKEKAFINGSTLEVRVSEIQLKDNQAVLMGYDEPQATPVKDTVKQENITTPISTVEPSIQSNNGEETKVEETKVEETKVEETKVAPVEEFHMSRFTSKEEARIRGIKSADISSVVAPKTFLKVDSARVDSLMNMVSELVIGKAALGQITNMVITSINDLRIRVADMFDIISDISSKHPEVERDALKKLYQFLQTAQKTWQDGDFFDATVNRVSRSINELQEGITKIRMVPIGNVFNRFPRMIRDISKQLGKKIRLEIFGEDTELDKTIIEELADPLIHMIRNSVDHGIEKPDIRVSKGKPEEGTVTLRAVHEGTLIRIEIQDDGAGLDPQRILKKAVEKGLVSPNHTLSVEEINQLILLPGFSTAEQVTDLSGRGVGMDVVKRNIEDLSGKLKIESEFGKGSKFIIKIPLTLSIIQALVFTVKGYFYAVPLSVISETVPLKQEDLRIFESSDVININNNLISAIDISKIFNLKESREDKQERFNSYTSDELVSTDLLDESLKILDRIRLRDSGVEEDYFAISNDISTNESIEDLTHKYLIVVQTGIKKVGLLVDSIISEQDIVIKPLDKRYGAAHGLSGATILGDGSISLILDVVQIVDLYLNKGNVVSL